MYSSSQGCHTATGTHMPHGITQCYLPPGRGDIPALTPAEAGTRLSDSGWIQSWDDLVKGRRTHVMNTFNNVFSTQVHPSYRHWAQCGFLVQESLLPLDCIRFAQWAVGNRYNLFSKWRPSAILDLLGPYLDHPRWALGGLWCAQNLIGIDAVVLIICRFQYFAWQAYIKAYSRPHKFVFFGNWSPKWWVATTGPRKGTTLHGHAKDYCY